MQDSIRRLLVETNIISCKIFSGCDEGFLHGIIMSLQQQIYCKKQVILGSTRSDGMYFVKSGAVEIKDNKRTSVKHKGEYFSEQAIISQTLAEHLKV